jgi:hypothetical protein
MRWARQGISSAPYGADGFGVLTPGLPLRCASPWAKFFDRPAEVAREPTSFPQSHLFCPAKPLQHQTNRLN